jgi:predicted nicotinamide N-methyase
MPGFQTKHETARVTGVADLQLRSLLDRVQFSDPDGVAEALGISSALWPLFGLLWPSAAQLASRLARREVRAGDRILEVGCGLALASLVAHRRGADVTASDLHPLAGEFLAHNVALNRLPPMKYRHGSWALPADGGATPVETVSGRFDLIVGSDVLYDRDASVALAGFVTRHAAPQCEVWIVDPDRGNRPGFNRRLAAAGFSVADERLDQPATPGRPAYRGRLLVYRRAAADGAQSPSGWPSSGTMPSAPPSSPVRV